MNNKDIQEVKLETILVVKEFLENFSEELNLRQRRWLELIKDYDCVIDYHLGKANVVVDVFSRKSFSSLAQIRAIQSFLKNELNLDL